jgi:hypothetical protein
MARETFLFTADISNTVHAGRRDGVDPNWTGYMSPACLFNKTGSGKVLRVRKIVAQQKAPITSATTTALRRADVVSITAHTILETASAPFKLDSTSAAFPATIQIAKNTYTVTESQSMMRSQHPFGTNGTPSPFFRVNSVFKWKDATTAEMQKLTVRNAEGIAIKGNFVEDAYVHETTIEVILRLSDTGATYKIFEPVDTIAPYQLTILNNGYTAGNIEILAINLLCTTEDADGSLGAFPTYNEFIFVTQAKVDDNTVTSTPVELDSTNSLNANILCLKNATVIATGQLTGSGTRINTVGNSFLRYTNQASIRDSIKGPMNDVTLFQSDSVEFDVVLREGNGIAFVPFIPSKYGQRQYISFLFTQENTEANAVYPSVGDVDLSVQYGPTGTDYTGTLVQPATTNVLNGVQYGAGGTEFTGSATAGGGGNVFILNE